MAEGISDGASRVVENNTEGSRIVSCEGGRVVDGRSGRPPAGTAVRRDAERTGDDRSRAGGGPVCRPRRRAAPVRAGRGARSQGGRRRPPNHVRPGHRTGAYGPGRDVQGLAVPGGVPRGPDRPEAPGEPRPGEPPARVARVTGGGEAGGRPDPGGDGRRGPRGAGTAPRGT